jgi:leader peptidase (prepilin peptidase) / N-methyltransferase
MTRSACPACHQQLAWYYLFPLISWMMLKGRCAYCKTPISWLYPCIEVITATSCTLLLFTIPPQYVPAYFIFFSALIVTIRTDIATLSILSLTTIAILPIGLLASAGGYLPLTFFESCAGALWGTGILWFVRKIFWMVKQQEGLGWGDIELLAMIGSFVGVLGVTLTLLIGSCTGSIAGGIMYLVRRPITIPIKVPFGAFLACGALITVLFGSQILSWLF